MADTPYLKHFGLKEEAFSPVPNPRFFFLTPTHAIAMEKTRLTVQSGKGLSVVYGEHGTGKSSLARLLHAQFLEKGHRSGLLTNPSFPTPFAEDAIPFLAEASSGNPREISILADNALLLSFLNKKPTVEREHVEQAVADRRQLMTQAHKNT